VAGSIWMLGAITMFGSWGSRNVSRKLGTLASERCRPRLSISSVLLHRSLPAHSTYC